MTQESFPLPTIQAQLTSACIDIHQGRGFSIVRGIDPREYTAEDNMIIFLAISSYIGEQRGIQDKKGTMLSRLLSPLVSSSDTDWITIAHVTESKIWTTPPEMRHGIHTTTSLASSILETS